MNKASLKRNFVHNICLVLSAENQLTSVQLQLDERRNPFGRRLFEHLHDALEADNTGVEFVELIDERVGDVQRLVSEEEALRDEVVARLGWKTPVVGERHEHSLLLQTWSQYQCNKIRLYRHEYFYAINMLYVCNIPTLF